jgi:hypothetical protein
VGSGGVSKRAFSEALRVGPIALGQLAVSKRTQLEQARPGKQRFLAIESIAIVNAGATVTVAVPSDQRGYVGLIYDKSKYREDGLYRIKDLNWVVRFEACTDPTFNHGYSQFDGGIVVARPRCFSLDIYVQGRRYRRSGLVGC